MLFGDNVYMVNNTKNLMHIGKSRLILATHWTLADLGDAYLGGAAVNCSTVAWISCVFQSLLIFCDLLLRAPC